MSGSAAGPIRAGLLAGVIAAALAIGSIPQAAPATAAEGCTWQRHSKRVVKKVRRHGQLRRVKRVKHWWTCARPMAAALTPTPPALPAGNGAPAEEPEPSTSRLSVRATEFSYTLSRPEVAAGETIVELNNQGEDPHNLALQREDSEEPPLTVPEAAALERTTAHFTLEPGTYRLYCSLFEHEAKGMHATLVVN